MEEFDVSAFRKFERDGYSRVAKSYADTTTKMTAQANGKILEAAQVNKGMTVLDVACGPGFLVEEAAARGGTVTAVDFAPSMVALARKRNPGLDVLEADAENLPFAENTFDAVTCALGMLHFSRPEQAAAEAIRVLKPGGRYVFTAWKPPVENPLMGLILGSIQKHGTLEVDLPAGPPLFQFGESAACEQLLTDTGFTDILIGDAELTWQFASPEELVEALPTSTARLGPMLSAQKESDRPRIEQAIITGARSFETAEGLRIPAIVIVASGRKP